jgi:tetratricopeptide (TPR) repeat protein
VPLDPDLVAVAPFTNETGDSALAPLGRLAAERVTQGIQQHGVAEVVPPAVAVAAAAEAREATDRVRAFAEATGAGVVLHGAYYLLGDSLQFQLQVTDATEATVLVAAEPVTGPSEPAAEALDLVRERTLPALAAALDFRVGIVYWPVQAPSLEVYRVYRRGIEATRRNNHGEALRDFEEASVLDSAFLPALIRRAEILTQAWGPSREAEGDSLLALAVGYRDRMSEYERLQVQYLLDEGTDAKLRTIRRLAELTPHFAFFAGEEALWAYRPREALEYWAQVDTANANFLRMGWYWEHTLAAHHELEEYETQLELTRAAPRDFGNRAVDWSPVQVENMLQRHQIAALAALGRTDELDVLLDSLMALPQRAEFIMRSVNHVVAELRAHGHRHAGLAVAQRMLDWLEARSPGEVGQMEEEITWPWYLNWHGICLFRLERYAEALPIFEGIGRDDRPEDWQGSAIGAYVATLLGDHERGRAHLERSPRSHYGPGLNAVMGNREEAMRLLHERFQRVRFRNQWMDQFHRAQSLDSLRGYPPFERFMRPRG